MTEHESERGRHKLYSELAAWWPLLSPPEEYAEEAALYGLVLEAYSRDPVRTLLELGSGGGSNASHLKRKFTLTLVDSAPEMLVVSRQLNPDVLFAAIDASSDPPYTSTSCIRWIGKRAWNNVFIAAATRDATSACTTSSPVCAAPSNPQ